jgi:hypothetical protein
MLGGTVSGIGSTSLKMTHGLADVNGAAKRVKVREKAAKKQTAPQFFLSIGIHVLWCLFLGKSVFVKVYCVKKNLVLFSLNKKRDGGVPLCFFNVV